MFIGHYAVALAAKKAAPRTSLGTLFMASQLMDLLFPVAVLTGLEHARVEPDASPFLRLVLYDYPFTHSLAGSLILSLLTGGLYMLLRRDARAAVVVGACVFSHWVLDFITHRPDLPLWFTGDARVGAGLWYSVAGTIIVEAGMFAAGIALYMKTTKPRDGVGTYAFWALMIFLAAMYAISIAAPTPTDVEKFAIGGNVAWLFVLWAWWADRHRTLAATAS